MNPGDLAPDFTLPDESGTPWRLSAALAISPVVVFFYPAALTMGCTKEACHFRDLADAFRSVGAQRVGVSADPAAVQQEFSRRNRLEFPLLSDVYGEVARAYGARRALPMRPGKRATFVIDRDRTVVGVVTSELSMTRHADTALEVLASRARRRTVA